ncbi:MAG TPA: tetratricopeptide repeat protein [Gaiellaceae bacterium]
MARGAAKQRTAPAKPKPAPRAKAAARRRTTGEDQMFFMRLRRGTKPIFIFLALVFAAGFVFLGVGSGSSGIGDLLRGINLGGGSSGTSISKAQDKIKKDPTDAAARLELARAYESKGRTDDAIAALTNYVKVRPRDVTALQELASLYTTKADGFQRRVQQAQLDAQDANLGSTFAPSAKLSQAVGQDPITQNLSTQAQGQIGDLYSQMQAAYGKATTAYKTLAKASPGDPNIQLELAQSAEYANQRSTAVAAYKRFLKLAPDDPSAGLVRQRLKQLKSSSTAPSSSSSG